VHGVVRWRLIDLAQWIFEEFRITIAKQTLSRELRAMGYRKLSARPRHHAQAEGVLDRVELWALRWQQNDGDVGRHEEARGQVPAGLVDQEDGVGSGAWQFMRDNWLSNRIFKSYDDLVDHCCAAWNKLVDQPWRIMSIGLRQWAHGF
jgi:hypothetical protein